MEPVDKSLGPVWEAIIEDAIEQSPDSRELFMEWKKRIEAECARDEQLKEAVKLAMERSGFNKRQRTKMDAARDKVIVEMLDAALELKQARRTRK